VFLEELAGDNSLLVVKLPKSLGERENRWTHLLCGEVALTEIQQHGTVDETVAPSELAALKAAQKQLADKVAKLQALAERMANELGIDASALTL